MSRAWLTIPSARPYSEIRERLQLWKQQGYSIALWRDRLEVIPEADEVVVGAYPGYAKACNSLIRGVFVRPDARWCVIGGDDTDPELNYKANEIAAQIEDHFDRRRSQCVPASIIKDWSTLGVMQPTGDRFAGGQIDRIAGSAWIGREWARIMYGGAGPLWHEYAHMFEDEELQRAAMATDTFLQRRDLIHLHHHFQRQTVAVNSDAVTMPVPAHLVACNTRDHWNTSKAIFDGRAARDWPCLRSW